MKSPAFQFYPTDYLGSQRVQMLTLEEEGAYVRLLCYCWQHGTIPDDADQLARLIGKGASTTVARVVQAMFQQGPDQGKLIHDRLEQERAKQAAWRAKSSAGGHKSAEKRKGGSTVVQPPLVGCLPNGTNQTATLRLQSSSQSSSNTKTAKSAPAAHLPFASVGFLKAWDEFRTHRRQIKKPLTPLAEEKSLAMLEEMGERRALAAINHTIAKGWQGLREPDMADASHYKPHVPAKAEVAEPHGWRDFARREYQDPVFLDPTSPRYAETWQDLDRETQSLISTAMAH